MFKWAVSVQHVKSDPTTGISVKKPKTKGFPPWSEEELEIYERRWPLGTRERVMFGVDAFTGLRRGDAAILGKQHIRNGVITIDTEKNDTRVTLPVLPELAEIPAAGPLGELSVIANKRGQPMSKETIGNLFRKAVRAAGIKNRSAHGIRKAAATRAADNGANIQTLNAIFGWKGNQMAILYTEAADRRRLAEANMAMMSKTGTSIPALDGKVRAMAKKIVAISILFSGDGGGRRTRTFEVIRRLIYSQLPLPLGTLPRSTPSPAHPPKWRQIRPWMMLKPGTDGGLPVGRFMGESPRQSQPTPAANTWPEGPKLP
jgi:hypothetical protein